MKNLSIDTHGHDHAADENLYKLLKEGEDPGEVENNEDDSVDEETPEPYDEPPTKKKIPAHFAKEVARQFKEGREELLKKYFSKATESASEAQRDAGKALDHAASGAFESSHLPNGKSPFEKQAMPTLREILDSVTKPRGK